MLVTIIATCLGTITNKNVTFTDDYAWVEFTTGNVMACNAEIKVKNGLGTLLAYSKDKTNANEKYKNFESVTLKIPRIE